MRAFDGLEDVEAARERLAALRDARDAARERLAELQAAAAPAVTVSATATGSCSPLDERRALIRAVVERARSSPPAAGATGSPFRARGE